MTELLRIENKLIFYNVFLICIINFFKSCDDLSDIFPPELAILEPQSDNVKPTFKVKLDVYDNNKIKEVRLILLNEEIEFKKKILRSEPWEHNFTVEESFEDFILVAKATDFVGNFVQKEVLLSLKGIAVTIPISGEIWQAGSSQTIRWESANLSGNYVGIDLYKSGNFCFRSQRNRVIKRFPVIKNSAILFKISQSSYHSIDEIQSGVRDVIVFSFWSKRKKVSKDEICFYPQ
tara:strand:+ start:518 stop:1219 length:702 start_codon:yes stop_codon:yes gene_type:complete